ncbi:protein yellow-like [Cloeon dipterum]|uniref:protein yellow-like n=1 Tax=Cloeon dipterum TaxID=197152 RepID=UPI0032208B9C
MSSFFAAIFLLGLSLANAVNFTTVYQWDKLDFIWPSGADSSIEEIKRNFNPNDVEFQYMAVFGERLFLSLELKDGIPATLVWLPTSGKSTSPPKLAPFPSWNLHKQDNCDSIQNAKGLETDPDGRLWVVDDGSSECPGKIWIFNLVNNDITERVHQFPDAVVSNSYTGRELTDIVLDKTTDDHLAYITDYYSEHIIVYSRKMDKSWSVITPGMMRWYSLALSPDREARQLYLGRIDSTELYSVSVSELKNEGGRAAVKLIGEWTENPYRMLLDSSANVLYAAFWYQSYLSKWNTSEPFLEQRFHEGGELDAEWPFTFALDTNGILWMTQRNNETGVDNKPRNKLLKAAVGARKYLLGTPTDLPLRG